MLNFHKKESPLLGLQGSGGGLGHLAGRGLPSDDFPEAYQNFINGYSVSNRRYYDPVNGNDSNDGQTPETAKRNVGTDMNTWCQGANNRIAILMPGTHIVTTDGPGSYGGRIFQTDQSSSYIGSPGKTIVRNATSGGGGDARDMHVFGMRSGSAYVIGMIIERDNEGRGNNYERAIWGYDASPTSGIVWNCVIRETAGNSTMSHIYDNSNGGDRTMERCLIDCGTMEGAYTCGTTSDSNLAFTASSHNFCSGVTNVLTNATYTNSPISNNPYYLNNGNNNTYGVYGGTYAWPQ